MAVDGARDELLAGARLALEEHGRGSGRDEQRFFEHAAQHAALAHDVVFGCRQDHAALLSMAGREATLGEEKLRARAAMILRQP